MPVRSTRRLAHALAPSAIALAALAVAVAATPDDAPTARRAPDQATRDAIRTAVLDYPESWYAGDGDRMKRRLHPDLAKRAWIPNRETGKPALKEMTAEQLISATARGTGAGAPAEKQRAEVTVLDVYENVASVKIVMYDWIDYAHVAKIDGEWTIVNVLWEPTPEARERWFGEHRGE